MPTTPVRSTVPVELPALPRVAEQAERLIASGAAATAGIEPSRLRSVPDAPGALLVVHPRVLPVSWLAPRLEWGGKSGFVVEDMVDVDKFGPVPESPLPDDDVYLVQSPTRGDEMRNWSPEEAAAALSAAGRTPLALAEGVQWVLQVPSVLVEGACFMTLGSRRARARGGHDARTPAVWVSRGTGRDGVARRGAPKVGWCWWRNRHTWLGFASATERLAIG